MTSLVWLGMTAMLSIPAVAAPADTVINVFENEAIDWTDTAPEASKRGDIFVLRRGQAIQRVIELPPTPADQRDARCIVARLIVEPVTREIDSKTAPGDPWTRLGSVSLILPEREKPKPKASPGATPDNRQIELMRFVTGFGGRAEYTADLTALAPLLQGRITLRVFISTYLNPAWKVTLTLTNTSEGVGQRRPAWAVGLLFDESVTSGASKLTASVNVPKGLEQPRLLITSTGHATDGAGGDEFVTRTHILRIDGIEVARWRPWAENGGPMRDSSPASGRQNIDGRELWSSDLDRSGWHPGKFVEPLRVPAPELTPGPHTIELEIVGIRPPDAKDPTGHHGYWRTSVIAVADEPWPDVNRSNE